MHAYVCIFVFNLSPSVITTMRIVNTLYLLSKFLLLNQIRQIVSKVGFCNQKNEMQDKIFKVPTL